MNTKIIKKNHFLLEKYRSKLADEFFVQLNESDFGIYAENRKSFNKQYFDALQTDMADVHKNRERGRDVFEYARKENQIHFHSGQSIELVNRNYEGIREYKRTSLIDNQLCMQLASSFVHMVPIEHTKEQGLLGVNLFRTFNVVTETRHQDFVDYVLIYCLSVNGREAITQLSLDKEGKKIVKEVQLEPGEILIFKDSEFFHYTTPLESCGNNPIRDVIIITIGV